MGTMATIRSQLGIAALEDLKADSAAAASQIEQNKAARKELRRDIDRAEDGEDAISSKLLAKQDKGMFARFLDSVNPFHHDDTEELIDQSKELQAGVERDETKLDVLGDAQKEAFDSVIDSDERKRAQLGWLQEVDRNLDRSQKVA